MFFADRPKALQEMVRVLAPQGRLAVAVWDSLEEIPAYAAEVPSIAIATHTGTARFPSVRTMVEAHLRGWILPFPVEHRAFATTLRVR